MPPQKLINDRARVVASIYRGHKAWYDDCKGQGHRSSGGVHVLTSGRGIAATRAVADGMVSRSHQPGRADGRQHRRRHWEGVVGSSVSPSSAEVTVAACEFPPKRQPAATVARRSAQRSAVQGVGPLVDTPAQTPSLRRIPGCSQCRTGTWSLRRLPSRSQCRTGCRRCSAWAP